MRWMILAAAVGLAGCDAEAETDAPSRPPIPREPSTRRLAVASPVAAPDLAGCPAREPVDSEMRERTAPIAVPAALRGVMRANVDSIAISTLSGATVCVDASLDRADRRRAAFRPTSASPRSTGSPMSPSGT